MKSSNDMNQKIEFSADEKEFLKKAERINQRIKQQLADDESKPQAFLEIIPAKEVATYKSPYGGGEKMALYFKGDVCIDGDLNEKWIDDQLNSMPTESFIEAFVIEGDLKINGDFLDGFFMEINVGKNFYSDYVFSQDAGVSVHGNAFVKFGIYGTRPSGWFDVDDGFLDTPYIFYHEHSMEKRSVSEFICFEADDGTSKEHIEIIEKRETGWYSYKNEHRFFDERVWDENDNIDLSKFFTLVRTGENPFKS